MFFPINLLLPSGDSRLGVQERKRGCRQYPTKNRPIIRNAPFDFNHRKRRRLPGKRVYGAGTHWLQCFRKSEVSDDHRHLRPSRGMFAAKVRRFSILSREGIFFDDRYIVMYITIPFIGIESGILGIRSVHAPGKTGRGETMKRLAFAAGVLAFLLMGQAGFAKTLEEVLKEKGVITEADFKEVTGGKPLAYQPGKGFTFTSPDARFQLSLGGRGQFFYIYLDRDDVNGPAKE